MNDQASALRQIVHNLKQQRSRPAGEGARVVCVTSGKGGVGKTSLTVNLAISLVKKGLRVLVIDADFGLANVDVMMGINPPYDLSHVINLKKDLKDIITDAPGGVRVVSGGSGVYELLNLSQTQLANVVNHLLSLDDIADVIIFDTGAGISSSVLRMVTASSEAIVVATPEPTAIMDAYALVKTVVSSDSEARIRLVINRAESAAEGEETLAKFAAVVRLYLKVEIEELGYVLSDPAVAKAVRLQNPFMLSFPKSAAAKSMENIAWKFMNLEQENSERKGLGGFLAGFMRKNAKER